MMSNKAGTSRRRSAYRSARHSHSSAFLASPRRPTNLGRHAVAALRTAVSSPDRNSSGAHETSPVDIDSPPSSRVFGTRLLIFAAERKSELRKLLLWISVKMIVIIAWLCGYRTLTGTMGSADDIGRDENFNQLFLYDNTQLKAIFV